MSKAEEIYGKNSLLSIDGCFMEQGDYTPIIEHLGKVAYRLDETGYQGDSYVFYKEEDKYGIMIFGWGSCSGCDSLQACNSIQDIDNLIEEMTGYIRWFKTAKELYDWINDERYQETQWHFHASEFDTFRKTVSDMLVKGIVEETIIKGES